jgi:hypothetical protein
METQILNSMLRALGYSAGASEINLLAFDPVTQTWSLLMHIYAAATDETKARSEQFFVSMLSSYRFTGEDEVIPIRGTEIDGARQYCCIKFLGLQDRKAAAAIGPIIQSKSPEEAKERLRHLTLTTRKL